MTEGSPFRITPFNDVVETGSDELDSLISTDMHLILLLRSRLPFANISSRNKSSPNFCLWTWLINQCLVSLLFIFIISLERNEVDVK